MPYTEPGSLEEDQTKNASFKEQANGRKREQLRAFLAVQPDDITGNFGTGSSTRWSEHKFQSKRVRWCPNANVLG